MKTKNKEFETLTTEQLKEIFSTLSLLSKNLNPERHKVTVLFDLGKDFALNVELRKLDVFEEIVERCLLKK